MNKCAIILPLFLLSTSVWASSKTRKVEITMVGGNEKHSGVYHVTLKDPVNVNEVPAEIGCFLFGPNQDEIQIACQDRHAENKNTIGTGTGCSKKSGSAMLIFHSESISQTILLISCKPE